MMAAVVATAFFMEGLDGTVIATALPAMAVSFGVDVTQLSIGITSYLLALAIFLPLSGWTADRFGSRNVFCGAIAVFTLSSIAAGLSPNLTSFVAARIVQGASAALMSPVGRLVIVRGANKDEVVRAINISTWPGLIGPVFGPPLGGFFATYLTWHWIFFLNVPIGIAGIALAMRSIDNHYGAVRRPFDGLGFALTAVTLAAIMYGLSLVDHLAWSAAFVSIAIGLCAGVLAVRHAKKHPFPLIDLAPLKTRTFAVIVRGGIFFLMSVGATPFLLPLFFQQGFGVTAFVSGLLVLGYAIGNLAIKSVTTPLIRNYGFRTVLTVNGVLSALAIVACGLLSPTVGLPLAFVLLVFAGAVRSIGLSCIFTLPYADIEDAHKTAASTLVGVVWQVGFGLGIAISTVILQLVVLTRHPGDAMLSIPDFRLAFLAVGVIGLLAVIDYAGLPRDAGARISGHKVAK